MRTRQALKNMIASFLLQVVLAVSGIMVPRFFTALYGSAVNGLVSSITQFITYMSLVEAGIGAAGTVALYGPLARKEIDEVNGVVSAAKSFYMKSGLMFVGLIAVLVLLYPGIVQNEIRDVGFIRWMIVILSISGIVDYFFLGKYRVLLQADQRGYVISLFQTVGTVIMTAVSLWLIGIEASALLVKGVAAAVYLLRSVAVAIYVKKKYAWVSFNKKPNMSAFNQRWAALLHQIVGMVVNNAAVILLTLCVKVNALVEVSVYSLYNLVGTSLSSLMNAISSGLGSGFGQVISQNEKEVLHKSYSSYEFLFFAVIFVAYSCMTVLLYPFVGLYSADFADAQVYIRWELVFLFSFAGLLQNLRLPGLTVICAAGHYKQTKWRAILEAAINIVCSLFLVGKLGISGVMIGICVSYLYRTTDVIIYTAKHFVHGSLMRTFKRLGVNFLTYAVMTGLGLYLIPQVVSGWVMWFVCAMVYGVAACIVFAGVNLIVDSREAKALLVRVRDLVKKE